MVRKNILKYVTIIGVVAGSIAYTYKAGKSNGYQKGLETADIEVNKIAQRTVSYALEDLPFDQADIVTGEVHSNFDVPNYNYAAIAVNMKKKAQKMEELGYRGAAHELSRTAGQLYAYHESQRMIRLEMEIK